MPIQPDKEPEPTPPKKNKGTSESYKTVGSGVVYGAALGMFNGIPKPSTRPGSKNKSTYPGPKGDKKKMAMQRAAQMRLRARNQVK